jgi:hypothetical protein
LLKELSAAKQEPMQAILEVAVEEYRRRCFLESVNEAYAALRSDDRTWAEMRAEQDQWDKALGDGLPPDDAWTEEGRPAPRKRGRRK